MLIKNHSSEKVRQFLFLPQRGKFVPKRAAIVHLHEVCFIQVWLQTEFTLWQSGSGEGLVWGTHSPVHSSPSSHRLSCWCQKPYVWVFCIDSWWSIFRKQRQSWSPLHIHFLLRRSMLSHKWLKFLCTVWAIHFPTTCSFVLKNATIFGGPIKQKLWLEIAQRQRKTQQHCRKEAGEGNNLA